MMLLILLPLIMCKPEFNRGFGLPFVLSNDRMLLFPTLLFTYKNCPMFIYELNATYIEFRELLLCLNIGGAPTKGGAKPDAKKFELLSDELCRETWL